MNDLFEDVRREVGCDFISDLKNEPYRTIAIKIASQLDAHKYSMREWEDFTQYICGEKSCVSSVENVSVMLLNKFNHKKFRLRSPLKLKINEV